MAVAVSVLVVGACPDSGDPGRALPGRVAAALGPADSASGCQGVTYQGCCDGQTLHYCAGGTLLTADCKTNPYCGWDAAAGLYNCGTLGQPEPTGLHPLGCPAPVDAGTDCGSVTWEGCCTASSRSNNGQTAHYCQAGKLKEDDCSSIPLCGWSVIASGYRCGTSGGADPAGVHPKVCVFGDAGPPTKPDADPGCAGLSFEGCCDGETLYYCVEGSVVSADCASLNNPPCGWNATQSLYDCGTSSSADPSGVYPKDCPFGDAGPPPKPDAPPGVPCGSVTWEGCCDSEILYWCEDELLNVIHCAVYPSCGWKAENNYYDCDTSGGADPSGDFPKTCPFDASVPAQPPDASSACGTVTYEGCCQGHLLHYCVSGHVKTVDCGLNPSCGWAGEYYDCGTDGGADPLGEHAIACGFDGGPALLDQGEPLDAPPPSDRSTHDSAGDAAPAGDSGCGCALVPRSPGGLTLLLLLALVVTLRRRPG